MNLYLRRFSGCLILNSGRLASLLVLILLFSLCGCGSSSVEDSAAEDSGPWTDAAPVVLIGADSTGKGAAGQVFFEAFNQCLSDLTDGHVTVDYHPNGELGGDADLLRQIQAGDIDLMLCQTAPMVSFVPEMAVFDLPMVFSDYDGDSIDAVLNGSNDFTAALDTAYASAGLHRLGFLQNATYRLTTANRDLSTLEDFQGLQIRTMENKNHMAFWTAIGAEPTPLAWAEVYIALQNGTIDAQENAADTCLGTNFQEVQGVLACTNHILYCNQMCMNADFYNSLDPQVQEALDEAFQQASELLRPQLKEIDRAAKQSLVEGGMVLVEYDADFYDSIRQLPAVQALIQDIDVNQCHGLGTILMQALAVQDAA